MILYHFDSNVIISAPFKSCADKYILLAYNSIMQSLKDRNMLVDLQMLDIEASAGYKFIVQLNGRCNINLVTPHIHLRNADKCTIRIFKSHFLSIFSGTVHNFPQKFWDLLLQQAELTLNIILQASRNPKISA